MQLGKGQKLRGKNSKTRSCTAAAKRERAKARKVLPGYPVKPFNMSKQEIEDYLSGEVIVCLLCGKSYKMLADLHLRNVHGISVVDYKMRYGMPIGIGLICAPLRKLRQEQGKDKTANLSPMTKEGAAKRNPARLSNYARERRRENMRVATEAKKEEFRFTTKLESDRIMEIASSLLADIHRLK